MLSEPSFHAGSRFTACSTFEKAIKESGPPWTLASYFHLRAGAAFASCGQWKFPEEATITEGKGLVLPFTVLLA